MSQYRIRRRIIGVHQGRKEKVLLVCLAAMHGNEPAGVQALDIIFKMLQVEPYRDPRFQVEGGIIGLLGNKTAYNAGVRFIHEDINRQLFRESVDSILTKEKKDLRGDDLEIYKMMRTIEKEVRIMSPERIVVLDLHTTTAAGGIFAIADGNTADSLDIGKRLGVPLIYGIEHWIKGTTLDYFNHSFHGIPCCAVVFEAGQHNDPLSVNRSVAVVLNIMRTLGLVEFNQVEEIHQQTLKEYANGLPTLCEVVYSHKIKPEDRFVMRAGYTNFQAVAEGEHLADDRRGKILCPQDGLMLMPLYQKQGEDGFFVITVQDDKG